MSDNSEERVEWVEVRLKRMHLQEVSKNYEVEYITTEARRRPFTIPVDIGVRRVFGYQQRFAETLEEGNIRAVNHGEFQKCAEKLIHVHNSSDMGTNRGQVVCLQRCRRGGKTFMATAVASLLEQYVEPFGNTNQLPFVIFISMNNWSRLGPNETAMDAVLSRIAYELVDDDHITFYEFIKNYTNFNAVRTWVQQNKIILLIDELNVISPKRAEYQDMSMFLDLLVSRKGGALLYTTHHRIEADLRAGREDEEDYVGLSTRPHFWQPMPRLNTLACIRYMDRAESFWSAVLRGRIPALLVLEQQDIENFMPLKRLNWATRQLMFNSILDGDIEKLEAGRTAFRSYAYLLKKGTDDAVQVWPPFLCAQKSVLGKDCPNLRANLQCPEINQPRAFEALAQLAVILQLMSSNPRYSLHNKLVPRHPNVSSDNSFEATAIFEVGEEIRTIPDLRKAVQARIVSEQGLYKDILQIVVIPLFSDFPIYDFFLFHRCQGFFRRSPKYNIAAGYQCKMGTKYPDEQHRAERGITKSIWIEGRGPVTRQNGKKNGWTLLSREEHQRFFGESLFAALPLGNDDACSHCRLGVI